MAVTLPVKYDLTIYTGTSFRREFRWLPDSNNPQDFTGWTARMAIGRQVGPPLTTLTTASQTIHLGPDGKIVLHMDPDHTGLLREGTFSYQLDLTDVGGEVTRFLRGRCEIVRDVDPS